MRHHNEYEHDRMPLSFSKFDFDYLKSEKKGEKRKKEGNAYNKKREGDFEKKKISNINHNRNNEK